MSDVTCVAIVTAEACTIVRVRSTVILDELAALTSMLRPGVRVIVYEDFTGEDLASWRVSA